MSNKPKTTKSNITKISAKSADAKSAEAKSADTKFTDTKSTNTKPANVGTKSTNTEAASTQTDPSPQPHSRKIKSSKSNPAPHDEKPLKNVFILARPFVAFGRYLRDSWREIRQVRWPGRKLTWKMTFAVLIYCAIFIVFIVLIDMFFTFIFNLLLNIK